MQCVTAPTGFNLKACSLRLWRRPFRRSSAARAPAVRARVEANGCCCGAGPLVSPSRPRSWGFTAAHWLPISGRHQAVVALPQARGV